MILEGRIALVFVFAAGIAGAQTGQTGETYKTERTELGTSVWELSGHDLSNTRSQPDEHVLDRGNVQRLVPRWVFQTGGSVSATPAVDESSVYVPDWSGALFRIDRASGQSMWRRRIADITGAALDYARATPAIAGDRLILGNQAGIFRRGGAKVFALDKRTGGTLWVTQVDDNPASIITQSAVVFDGRVFVGVSSGEEYFAGLVRGYVCCTFRGSVVALDLDTGAILWKTYTVPDVPGFSGNSVWGSTPVVDRRRDSLYVTTGNNYTVPEALTGCIEAVRSADPYDEAAVRRCIDAVPGNYFDAVISLDLATGAVKWARSMLSFDAWTLSCVIGAINPGTCPSPSGPDHDFGQGPALFSVDVGTGSRPQRRDLLGAGQKSGTYWALDPDTGDVVWQTKVGPAGLLGGLLWGSATDGERVYVSNVNSTREEWTLVHPPAGSPRTTRGGFWCALDARTGEVLWQTADPNRKKTEGAVTVANGVVFAGSMARGSSQDTMFALDARTGSILWRFASGATVDAGAAVADGMVFWGSGYPPIKGNGGTANDKLFAFGLPEN